MLYWIYWVFDTAFVENMLQLHEMSLLVHGIRGHNLNEPLKLKNEECRTNSRRRKKNAERYTHT